MDDEIKLLFGAASSNVIPVVEKILEKPKPPDINYVSFGGDSALNIAVTNNHEAMVRFLVKNGALINNERVKYSPLFVAIKFDLRSMASTLIELGASLEIGWYNGKKKLSPLRFAVQNLNYKMLELLIQKGANVCATNPQDKRTALHEVGDYVDSDTRKLHTKVRLKMAKLLLKNKADICARDRNCRTPLDGAIIDNAELSKFFIKEGAEVRRKMTNGFLIDYVLYVTNLNSPELITLCLERGSNYSHAAFINDEIITAYHRALRESTPEVVKVFWKFGCPVDLPVAQSTPRGGSFELSDKDVQINAASSEMFHSQLNFIKGIVLNDPNVVLTAIKKGAEPKVTSLQVNFPLYYTAAIKNGHPKIVRALLKNGVPVNRLVGNLKTTSLYFALLNNNLGIVKEILKFGGCFFKSEIEKLQKFKNKETQAVMEEIIKAFKFTRRGSNKVLKQIRQFLSTGNKEMARILMNCVDRQGRSLMNIALEKGHVKVAAKLMRLRIDNF